MMMKAVTISETPKVATERHNSSLAIVSIFMRTSPKHHRGESPRSDIPVHLLSSCSSRRQKRLNPKYIECEPLFRLRVVGSSPDLGRMG